MCSSETFESSFSPHWADGVLAHSCLLINTSSSVRLYFESLVFPKMNCSLCVALLLATWLVVDGREFDGLPYPGCYQYDINAITSAQRAGLFDALAKNNTQFEYVQAAIPVRTGTEHNYYVLLFFISFERPPGDLVQPNYLRCESTYEAYSGSGGPMPKAKSLTSSPEDAIQSVQILNYENNSNSNQRQEIHPEKPPLYQCFDQRYYSFSVTVFNRYCAPLA